MADIELVIKIPEELYKATINGLDADEIWDLRLAVKNGISLPNCEDCVSRADVLNLCDSKDAEYKVKHFKEDVECLPSVYPKQKTGHWIIIDDCEQFIAKCSECGRIEDSRMISKYPYCHCGAKMIEP